jgi:hypothetical protein
MFSLTFSTYLAVQGGEGVRVARTKALGAGFSIRSRGVFHSTNRLFF